MDVFFILVLVGASILGYVTARIVAHKGHENLFAWWLFGFLIFIIALPMALTAEDRTTEDHLLNTGARRACPSCSEPIRKEALVCRYCGRDVPEQEGSSGPTAEELEQQYEEWTILRKKVLKLLRSEPRRSVTTSELERIFSGSPFDINEVLQELMNENKIRRTRLLMSPDWVWEVARE